jgi:hypothetical protein
MPTPAPPPRPSATWPHRPGGEPEYSRCHPTCRRSPRTHRKGSVNTDLFTGLAETALCARRYRLAVDQGSCSDSRPRCAYRFTKKGWFALAFARDITPKYNLIGHAFGGALLWPGNVSNGGGSPFSSLR